ncbi:aminoacetone oxidase family FAD-binding enzyme [Adlercreutzia sp. ZJ473]|uniref:aminoacetone oxidase family FAD-binding enzyme n=1 Tax=Adlercreutzia sp. ZJ473 TaxID=2722822 RepID=UPI0020A61FE3|nr:aminoacetone oxidase family FAD-binding enzyme [Adlercreutzia sp. ZJ473]
MTTLAIIGGGAAGLAAAVAAAEDVRAHGGANAGSGAHGSGGANAGAPAALTPSASASSPDAGVRVAVLEADERVGRSILATGNGRCNFSNARIDPKLYRNAKFVEAVLGNAEALACGREPSRRARFSPGPGAAVLDFFAAHGLMWREESEGRLYPQANKASAVLDVLRAAAAAAGVEVRCDARVDVVEPPRAPGKPFTLRLRDGAFFRADAVVVACGGRVAHEMLPDALAFRAQRPVLGPIATETRLVRQLDNIRVRGALELWRAGELLRREPGEVMFRKYGVSGIAAFNLSRHARPGDELAVDFLPRVELASAPGFLARRRAQLVSIFGDALTCEDFLRGMVLPQVAHVLLESLGHEDDTLLASASLDDLARVLKRFTLAVEGPGDARQCQVTRGGFDVAGFDVRTLEARAVPGLYAAGEALDVDAPCGGYNLHWAWASGLLAGRSAVRALGAAQNARAAGVAEAARCAQDAEGAEAARDSRNAQNAQGAEGVVRA